MFSMTNLLFLFSVVFVGIYLNVFLLLLLFKNRNRLFEVKKPSRLPKVSVLIPAHNEEKSIAQTLNSVLALDYPSNKLEIIVIDNGSTDNTSEVVRKFKAVKLLRLPRPGKAYALNEGLKIAKGELISILDADTTVSKDCLKKMVGFFEDKNVGAVSTHVKVDSSKGFLATLQNIEYHFAALSKKLISYLDSLYVVPGTLSLIRADIIKKIRFNDDTLTEDMDVAITIHKKGYKIVNCLDATAFTIIPKSLKKITKQRIRWYRGFIENTFKHSDVLFNKKYPHLGFFIIPSSYLAIFIGIILTILLFLNIWDSLFLFVKSLFYVNILDKTNLLLTSRIDLLNFPPYTTIFYALILGCAIVTFTLIFKILGFKDKKVIILLPFYLIGYYTLIMIYWFFAIGFEVLRLGKKW